MKTALNPTFARRHLRQRRVFSSLSRSRFVGLWVTTFLFAWSAALPPAALAFTARGNGQASLIGHDLTDPEDDGDPENNVNYNATFAASEEPGFGNSAPDEGEAAFNVFDNRVDEGGNDKWCCGDKNNFPVNPISIDATFASPIFLKRFTLTSGDDSPERDPRVWEIQGSNDGINFTTIYSRNDPTASVWGTNLQSRGLVVEFDSVTDYAPPAAYRTIRFITTKTGATVGARFQLSEIEYFEPDPIVVTTTTDEDNLSIDPAAGGGTGTSLREALKYAATLSDGQKIIFSKSGAVNFHDGKPRTITIDTANLGALPHIASNLIITGPGARLLTVTSDDASETIFQVNGGANATISDLTISGGHSGIYNQGTLAVRDCTISGNLITGISSDAATATTATNCAITGNKTGIAAAGTVTATNCTISGSLFGLANNSGTVTVTNCTISGNGSGISNTSGTMNVANTIVAGNGTNSSGTIDDVNDSNILSGTATDAGLEVNGNGDPVRKNNGGPTDTIKLVPNSPAIDAGDNALALDASSQALATDQRGAGFNRVVKGKPASATPIVDLGAFEVQPPVVTFADGVAENGVQVNASDAPLDLNGATIGATPEGGTFSGTGVDDNGFFHPETLVPGTYEITYTTSTPDDYGNTGSATFTITVIATGPYLRIIATAVPGGHGIDVPGEPAGTKFTQLGLASMDNGEVGARVRIKPPNDPEVPAIFVSGASTSGGSGLAALGAPGPLVGIVARGGGRAPGTMGSFASFGEPVFGGNAFAFTATLTGVPKANDTGLWSSLGGTLDLVAGEGQPAPDADGNALDGANFDKIQSYALSADGKALTFIATLKGTSVKGPNKTGVWQHWPKTTRLLFRTGDLFQVTTGIDDEGNLILEDRPIKSLKLFVPAKTIPGQRRSYAGEQKRVMAFATFAGRQGLIGFNGQSNRLVLENTNVGRPGLPSINRDGYFAMRAGLTIGAEYAPPRPGKVTAKDDQTILTGRDQFHIGILSQEGSRVSSTNPEIFTAFEEPAFNNNYSTAFFATVTAPGLPASQNRVLIYDGLEEFNYEPTVIARTGKPAAGLTEGELWKDFTAMALPDSNFGPVFLATLEGLTVKATNSIGLWATDLDGNVRLLLRTGDTVPVNGVDRTVSLINTLGAALDSPGQGRYVDLLGNVSAQLTFTDGTTALVYFGLPTSHMR
jgi:hypothetical protein